MLGYSEQERARDMHLAAWHERELEHAAQYHLEQAVKYAYKRFRDDYSWDYIAGTLESIRPARAQAENHRKPLSANKRRAVFERDSYRCVACDGFKRLSVDHIIPVSQGGSNDNDNLQTLCGPCNSAKGTKPIPFQRSLRRAATA